MAYRTQPPPGINKPYNTTMYVDQRKQIDLFSMVLNLDTTELLEYSLANKVSLNISNGNDDNLIHVIIKLDPLKASEHIKLNIIKFLIDNDVNPDKQNKNNQTPLHLACEEQYPKIVGYLLDIGVEPNSQDNMGNTPFYYLLAGKIRPCEENVNIKKLLPGVKKNFLLYINDFANNTINRKINEVYINTNIVRTLLEYSANPFIKNLHGYSPIHNLLKLYNYNILKLIIKDDNSEIKDYDKDAYIELLEKSKNYMEDNATLDNIVEHQYRDYVNRDIMSDNLKFLFKLASIMACEIYIKTEIYNYFTKNNNQLKNKVFNVLCHLLSPIVSIILAKNAYDNMNKAYTMKSTNDDEMKKIEEIQNKTAANYNTINEKAKAVNKVKYKLANIRINNNVNIKDENYNKKYDYVILNSILIPFMSNNIYVKDNKIFNYYSTSVNDIPDYEDTDDNITINLIKYSTEEKEIKITDIKLPSEQRKFLIDITRTLNIIIENVFRLKINYDNLQSTLKIFIKPQAPIMQNNKLKYVFNKNFSDKELGNINNNQAIELGKWLIIQLQKYLLGNYNELWEGKDFHPTKKIENIQKYIDFYSIESNTIWLGRQCHLYRSNKKLNDMKNEINNIRGDDLIQFFNWLTHSLVKSQIPFNLEHPAPEIL